MQLYEIFSFLLCSSFVQNVLSSCFHQITNSSGTIHVLQNTLESTNCTYMIKKSDKLLTHVQWLVMNAGGSSMPNCTDHYVRITRCTFIPTPVVRYCGNSIPHDYFFTGNCLRIDTYNHPGFKLTYNYLTVTRPQISRTDLTVIKKYNNNDSLNIFSPNWPYSYNQWIDYDNHKTPYSSSYRIDLSNIRGMNVVFMAFDLYQQYNRWCSTSLDDTLTFKFYRKDLFVRTYKYCGYKQPFTKTFRNLNLSPKSLYVDVIFSASYWSRNNRRKGFSIGVTLFKDDMRKEEKGGNKIPYSLFVIPVILLIFVFYCFISRLRIKIRQNGGVRAIFQTIKEKPPTEQFVPQQSIHLSPRQPFTSRVNPLYPSPEYKFTQ